MLRGDSLNIGYLKLSQISFKVNEVMKVGIVSKKNECSMKWQIECQNIRKNSCGYDRTLWIATIDRFKERTVAISNNCCRMNIQKVIKDENTEAWRKIIMYASIGESRICYALCTLRGSLLTEAVKNFCKSDLLRAPKCSNRFLSEGDAQICLRFEKTEEDKKIRLWLVKTMWWNEFDKTRSFAC